VPEGETRLVQGDERHQEASNDLLRDAIATRITTCSLMLIFVNLR